MYKHGQAVTLTGVDGTVKTGTLHLPDQGMSMYTRSGWKEWDEPRMTSGALGVHAIILADGARFRTHGRLSQVVPVGEV